jgi:hypothetical protein
MKRTVPLLLLCALAWSLARGDVVSQTNTFSGTPNFSGVLVFDKFNAAAAGWTVTQIVVSSALSIDGFSLSVSNIGAGNATLDAYAFGARNRVIITPLGETNTIVATNAGEPGTVIAPGEKVTINGTRQDSSSVRTVIASNEMAQFLGSGTFDVNYSASQTKTVSTTGSTTDMMTPSTAWGSVVLSFFYAVPEPSTWMMIGTGAAFLLVVAGRRREG